MARNALPEAAGREPAAAAIEKTGIATAVGVREKLLAEVTAKEREAHAIELRMLAEAKGLTEKVAAMQNLQGAAREHEEFRLRLENERLIALEQIKARVQMTESQAKVMATAMGNAEIKIVGGDGQFFDRFVKAVALGESIDGVFDNSKVVQKAVGDRLNGNGHKLLDEVKDMAARAGGAGGDSTISKVLGNLMLKADDSTKSKLKELLDQARKLGVSDDKVS